MDDTTLAYLEKNKDDANPSYWIPKLIAEIRRLQELLDFHRRAAERGTASGCTDACEYSSCPNCAYSGA